jgi:hypothetical protein
LLAIPTASRQRPLGPGSFEWRRWPLGLGPAFRLTTPALAFDASGGPALAWLHFSGNVFDHTFQPNGVAWGAFVSVRAATRGRHWGLVGWVDAQYYPAVSRVYASGVADDWALPKLSLGALLGVRFSP